MASALNEVRESIQRNLDAKKGGSQKSNSAVLPTASTVDWSMSKPSKRHPRVRRGHLQGGRDPGIWRGELRAAEGEVQGVDLPIRANEDPIHQHMATLMISFLACLFVCAGKFEEIKDNLYLERWFRLPKSHERLSTVVATPRF